MNVKVTTRGRTPRGFAADVQRQIEPLDRLTKAPILDAHVVLTQDENPRLERPARAAAEVDLNGHIIRARVSEVEMRHAIDQLAEQLARHLREFVDIQTTVHRRPTHPPPGKWRHRQWAPPRPAYLPRPAGERQLIRRKALLLDAMSPIEAAELMDDLNHDFLLFRHIENDSDAVVYRSEEGHLTVIVPAGTELPEAPVAGVEYEHSRLPEPLALEAAVAEMNELNHRFMFFVNSESGRGNVIHLRNDGHYGLIEPAS
jgi:ribosome-associated translation inhibitor RaiA